MKFKIMCHKGDAAYDYTDLEMAEIKFDELKTDGMLPMVIEPEGKKRVLQNFEPDINEVVWMPGIMGG